MDPNASADESTSPQIPEEPSTPPPTAAPAEPAGAPGAEEPTEPAAVTEVPAPESEAPQPEEPKAVDVPAAENEPPVEATDTTVEPAADGDPLTVLADQALKTRLSPADEERTASLLKTALLEGRKGVEHAVAQLPKLPWVIGVNGVAAAWPEMKTTFRARLIGGLAKVDTDAARRVRLSLARGLFKQDIPAAMKLATSVAKEMREKETGAVHPKNAQIFANVLIGRAKPWISQVPLADLKPADGDLLVHCAVMSVFGMPHAPATQLGVIKWAAAAERLGKLHPAALEALIKGVSRWSAKWQGALRKEVAQLPEEILAVLKPLAAPAPAPTEAKSPAPTSEGSEGEDDTAEEPADREDEDDEGKDEADREEQEDEDDREEDDEDEDAEEEEGEERKPRGQRPQPPKQRPVYESKTMPSQPQQRRGAANFNLSETLKQIEAHVAGLRSELQSTQGKLRQREDELRKPRRNAPERGAGTIIPGEPTPEELARLNRQLEMRNVELQEQIQELRTDSEDRAASMAAPESTVSPDAQLRVLLAFKLKEDFEDFAALEKEAPDIVVQQHYRTVLRHVFEVLRGEGVHLEEAPESH